MDSSEFFNNPSVKHVFNKGKMLRVLVMFWALRCGFIVTQEKKKGIQKIYFSVHFKLHCICFLLNSCNFMLMLAGIK